MSGLALQGTGLVQSSGSCTLRGTTLPLALGGVGQASGFAVLAGVESIAGIVGAGVAQSSGYAELSGISASRPLAQIDPLWVAVEIDLWDSANPQNSDGTTTLRLSNRGILTRTIGGDLFQYDPRLKVPFELASTLTIFSGGGDNGSEFTMFQEPLRGQTSATIEWAIDTEFAQWLNPGQYRWLGSRARVYEGETKAEVTFVATGGHLFPYETIDVDTSLTLIYTGAVSALSFVLGAESGSQTGTVQITDGTVLLDKSLVDEFYDSSFPTSLQGKPKPQLWGRRLSIEPVLEDAANLVYRVSRTSLDDITEVRVGGVPWARATAGSNFTSPDLSPSLTNLLAQYNALSASLQAQYDSVVGSDPANFNNGAGLQNKVNLVALLTAYNALSTSRQGDYNGVVGSETGFYNNSPSGIVNKFNLIKSFYGTSPGPGQWSADLANGTFQLGASPLGAELRCNAQASGYATLTTANLITEICNAQGVGVDPSYMAQLNIDWPGLIGFYTGTTPVNCLDALDRITQSNLCWWSLGPDGAVIAGFVSGPETVVPDMVLASAPPGVAFDVGLLPGIATDPVPKEIAAFAMVQIVPPAWRVRMEFASNESPAGQFLEGVTFAEQQEQSEPGLVEDWTAGNSGWSLSPSDGNVIRQANPKAQDLYIRTLAWREAEANALRLHLVQNITGNIERQVFNVSARIDASSIKLFQVLTVLWVDVSNRTRALYGSTCRVISATRSIGGGSQQLVLWGSGGSGSGPGSPPTMLPPPVTAQIPTGISFTVFTIPSTSLAGTIVAIAKVTTNNGLPFAGTYGFGAPNGNAGLVAFSFVGPTQGVNILLSGDLSDDNIGSYAVTFTATENGVIVSNSFNFTVTATPAPARPIDMSLSTSFATVPDDATAGTVLAAVIVTMSDGSVFSGTLTTSNTDLTAISGNRVVLARDLSAADDGPFSTTISVGQGGTELSLVMESANWAAVRGQRPRRRITSPGK
jgi:hypothetical protein